jgi:hypothetical protein
VNSCSDSLARLRLLDVEAYGNPTPDQAGYCGAADSST